MGSIQKTFKRYEKKYTVTEETAQRLMELIGGRIREDAFGKTTVCSIYFDTPSHRLIRSSIEKPAYKEKLRIRSYGVPDDEGMVFVELKKKYDGVVYKRRVYMPLCKAKRFIFEGELPRLNPQIENEIAYFLNYYEDIAPSMFISCERVAFEGVEDPALRITFDSRITYRETDLKLESGVYGKKLLPDNVKIMEIKIPGAMPLWLSDALDELKIFPSPFSKYGEAYMKELTAKINNGEENCYA